MAKHSRTDMAKESSQSHVAPAFEVKKSRPVHKGLIIGLGVLAAAVASVYVGGAIYFMSHFFPNTTMGSLDLSLNTVSEASGKIDTIARDFTLHVSGQGLDFTIDSQDSGIEVDSLKVSATALDSENAWIWPVALFEDHDVSSFLEFSSSKTSLQDVVYREVGAFNQSAEPSQDAYVFYNKSSLQYEVAREVVGTQLDPEKVLSACLQSITNLESSVPLTSEHILQPALTSQDEGLQKSASDANALITCNFTLKVAGSDMVIQEINGNLISTWISFDETGVPTLDSEAMKSWVSAFADSLNTIGSERTYTRPDGKEVTASGGDYGWVVDESVVEETILESIVNGTTGDVYIDCVEYGNGWTAIGQDWGAYIDVDLSEQWAYYINADGEVLWDSPVITGLPDGKNNTPTGLYWLKAKQTNIVLVGKKDPETGEPEYRSPVDYWMPFKGNTYGLHDATWQAASYWGNNQAYTWAGSHGCVNLPLDAAAELYELVKVGDPVIVHW